MKPKHLLFGLTILSTVAVKSQTNTFPSSGKVGIGTTTPSEKLHIYRDSAGYYNPILVLEDHLNTGLTQLAFKGTGRTYHIGLGNNGETGLGVANKFYLWDQTASAFRMILDASGNFGFGTTAPGNRISIYSATANTSGLQFSRLNNTATAGSSNGKVLSLDASGNVILVKDSLSASAAGWSLSGNGGTNPSSNFFGTTDNQDLAFKTNNTERLRVLSNGNMRVGSGSDKGKTFQVFGTGYFSSSIGIGTDSINDTNYRLFVAQGIRTRKVKVDVAAWPDYVFDHSYALMPLNDLETYLLENKHLPGIESASDVEKNGVNLGDSQAALLKKVEELTLYIIDQNKAIRQLQDKVESLTAEAYGKK